MVKDVFEEKDVKIIDNFFKLPKNHELMKVYESLSIDCEKDDENKANMKVIIKQKDFVIVLLSEDDEVLNKEELIKNLNEENIEELIRLDEEYKWFSKKKVGYNIIFIMSFMNVFKDITGEESKFTFKQEEKSGTYYMYIKTFKNLYKVIAF